MMERLGLILVYLGQRILQRYGYIVGVCNAQIVAEAIANNTLTTELLSGGQRWVQ